MHKTAKKSSKISKSVAPAAEEVEEGAVAPAAEEVEEGAVAPAAAEVEEGAVAPAAAEVEEGAVAPAAAEVEDKERGYRRFRADGKQLLVEIGEIGDLDNLTLALDASALTDDLLWHYALRHIAVSLSPYKGREEIAKEFNRLVRGELKNSSKKTDGVYGSANIARTLLKESVAKWLKDRGEGDKKIGRNSCVMFLRSPDFVEFFKSQAKAHAIDVSHYFAF
jgi:hypothetical protein